MKLGKVANAKGALVLAKRISDCGNVARWKSNLVITQIR